MGQNELSLARSFYLQNPDDYEVYHSGEDVCGELVRFFQKDGTGYSNVPYFISVDNWGDTIRVAENPPKEKGIVIGLGNKDQIVTAFPFGQSRFALYHSACTTAIVRWLGDEFKTAVFGHIMPEEQPVGKATHVITIAKMHPRTRISIGSEIKRSDLGFINPEEYISESIAQRILSGFYANRMEIRYAPYQSS